ncbi:uncharacterized protein LOC106082465 isoform X8 [Stomoxys calcitrans]|uniref:uncharacterized protein LOC106082465 isoform X8 n=1 Tax=Stomoxys calcitrans TaxID=35570 RepID=UPI0027E2C83C|nr:uncharacterized protein LOC106082465 isoform X8 [Stomoxys calcitrans]
MFKFPLKRHHNNNNNSSGNNQSSNHHHHNSKSATSLSNEGFIFIRCGHNHLNNNPKILQNFRDNNSGGPIAHGGSSSSINNNINNITASPPANVAPHNNKYVAKSTVQSSWRPQLPLPQEIQLSNENINHQYHHHPNQLSSVHQQQQDADYEEDLNKIQIIESDMDRFHKKDPSFNGSQISNGSNGPNSSNKKWSFGRLFRRGKKEIESESSSEDDRKAGFSPAQKYPRTSSAAATSTPNKKSKSKSSATAGNRKMTGSGFDHIVVSPTSGNSSSTVTSPVGQHIDNEFFLPVETISPMGSQEPFYQNNNNNQHQQTGQGQRLHQSQQYLPHVPQTQQQLMSKSVHSLDRRSTRSAKPKPTGPKPHNHPIHSPHVMGACSSSEEELISLNSSTFSKYRSDESIHSGGQGNNGSIGGSGGSRRSRAARNERYYKRLSRDGEVSHGQVPIMFAQQPTQRWKTQPVPLSIYQAQPARPHMQQPQAQVRSSADNVQHSKLRNTTSLQHMAPYVQWNQQRQQQQPKNLQNSVNAAKRSISYDSQIHLQNVGGRMQSKPLPPPPPPRDPLRKVNISGHIQDGSSGDLRPISYAFDQAGVPVLPATGLSGRCVSDDKIWAQHQPQYQSIRSLNIVPNHGTPAQPQHRRFITRADRDAHPGKKSLPNGLDFHYVADATPRSRKPIHMLDTSNASYVDEVEDPPSSGVLRTTKSGLPTSPTKLNANEFWKRMEGSSQNIATPTPVPRGRDVQRSVVDAGMKPRSVSTSRVPEMRAYPMPMYSEVYKPNKTQRTSPQQRPSSPRPNYGHDEVDGVVCGSLRIQPGQDNASNFVEIRNRDVVKSQSMPEHYHRRSGEIPNTPNKYEEYVNERREQHQKAPQPPQRKLSGGTAVAVGIPHIPQFSFPRKKPANLEEAINELEAIYKSLGLTEPEPEVVKKDRVPTPNDFEKFALAHAHEYDDEDSPTGEPDPIRDDVAYRNIKLANLQHKTVEKQPPFGIPLGPIVPASQTDYLHVVPNQQLGYAQEDMKAPDVVKDDLAVRALRKDPAQTKEKIQYPSGGLQKKNRATRTQSANIYALIQRDAAKPSGGDLLSYLELTKSIDRSESMSDLHKKEATSDVPSTLKLLQSLKEQEREQTHVQCTKKHHVPFRHPSQGGAICQLPQKLSCAAEEKKCQHKPVPMPRKSLTPEPQHVDTYKMEEALNKIAQEAEESSIKLSQELQELRKEALITNSKPKRLDSQEEKFEQELQEIEKVSQAAKKCGKMLLDTLPDAVDTGDEGQQAQQQPARKLHKEDKLIKAIDQVSEAANKVCEKILKDIVTTEPPVVVQEAVQVKQQPKAIEEPMKDSKPLVSSALVMPTLIKKLDPIQSDKIEAIAMRCMRQLSDLADSHDYDNLNQPEVAVASNCNVEDTNTQVVSSNDLSTSNLTEMPKPLVNTNPKQMIDEIDQIMRECEDQARKQEMVPTAKVGGEPAKTAAPVSSTTTSSFSSSSDCLAKSSSPTASRRFSSSITSFNPYSSSDYIKSPSSDYHAPSTDRIKSCSTTSYDVQSTTSATPNKTITTTTSNVSCSPSPPPLNLTPVSNCSATLACSPAQRARSSSPSQYNSSEELAMIFGIEEQTKKNRTHQQTQQLQKHSESATNSSANDLTTSALATAKTSCQLQQQNPQQLQLQYPQSEQQQQSLLKKQQNFKHYQGHHPHFHHHTAPAYYTDLHLRIHTPEVKDSLNENYQSVYRTPSNLVRDERQFPKSATATVAPPPITGSKSPKGFATEQQEGNSTTSSSSFFRGAGCGHPQEEQLNRANEPYGTLSPSLVTPAKGNSPQSCASVGEPLPPLAANVDGSVVFACTNFKPCVATAELVQTASNSPKQSPLAPRSSRNTQRFSNRRRAVRVRSESRPISALYDIICKEKGLDIGTTTTNDEDSSPQQSHDEKRTKSRRSHSRSVPKQNVKASSYSGGMMSPGGDASQTLSATGGQKKRSKDKHSSPSNMIFINDLSDNEDDEGGCTRKSQRLKTGHRQRANVLGESQQSKSASLPPGLKGLSDLSLNAENHNNFSAQQQNHHNHHHHHHHQNHPSNNKVAQDSFKSLQTSSASDNVLNANYSSLPSSSSAAAATGPAAAASYPAAFSPSAVASGAGTNAPELVTVSPNKTAADRFQRKYRRTRGDEKPRRHTDGAIKFPAATEPTNEWQQQQPYSHHHNTQQDDDGHNDDAGVTPHRHSQHRHHHHTPNHASPQPQHHPHLHDLNGAGHDSHVYAANAKRFITRSQRATSAGIINGAQPSDSSSSASNSPIPGRLSPTSSSTAAAASQHQEIPLLSKSPTVGGGKTENGFAPKISANAANDITNNSGSGGSVKPPTSNKTPSTAVADSNASASSTKINSHALALNSEIPLKAHQEDNSNLTAVTTEATATAAPAETVVKPPPVISVDQHLPYKPFFHCCNLSSCSFATSALNPAHSACFGLQLSNPMDHQQQDQSCHQQQRYPTLKNNVVVPTITPSKQYSCQYHPSYVPCSTCFYNSNGSNPSVSCNYATPTTSSVLKQRKHTGNCLLPKYRKYPPLSPLLITTGKAPTNNTTFTTLTNTTTSQTPTLLVSNAGASLQLCETANLQQQHSSPGKHSPTAWDSCNIVTRHDCSSGSSSVTPLSPNSGVQSLSVQLVRTTKTTRLRAAALDEAAARRRRRRELGMARTLVPAEDAAAAAVKELITSPSYSYSRIQAMSPTKPAIRNDLSYHLEMARRGLDPTSTANALANRRRAQTASPKQLNEALSSPTSGANGSKAQTMPKVSRRSDTVAIGELRKQRTDEVNRKMNERTRSDLAEIMKIAENANESSETAADAIAHLTNTMHRLRISQERDENENNRSSPSTTGKHATFHEEKCIYYDPEPLEHVDHNGGEAKERSILGGILRYQRLLKARSIERESSFEPPKLSPILRRKSTDDPLNSALSQTPNQIVSILKKKDHLSACESSSASSNASPVTFSASVMDTPSKQKRAGILKKRSSLDESRYYSRSHSPDERSIFIKSARRNSLEETAANGGALGGACSLTQGTHGILKQSSYDSFKSDSCPSAGGAVGGGGGSAGESQHPHSILKKKDSTSTPSDSAQHGGTKHVSISQAVILAAAELSANEPADNSVFNEEGLSFTPCNEEYDIKPILKLETSISEDAVKPPKPILKKKSSGDSDEHEIKPILKTSRKSSREEFDFDPFSEGESAAGSQEPLVRPILKTDSPSKRRSLGSGETTTTEASNNGGREANSPFLLKRRTRSLERQDQTPVIDLGAALNAIATSQENTDDLVASLTSSTPGANISVTDRIKSMEKFLTNQSATATTPSGAAVNTSWESPLQNAAEGAAAPAAVGAKILKPSVIRRDLLKDRYKTQPITSDEKNFFKSNDSSTLYTSPAGSAFKPAKSLEGLGFINITAHGNQSPNAAPSAFALTRSYTQPLQPTLSSSSFKACPIRKTPNRSSTLQLNESSTINSDLTQSFTGGDSGLSCDSNIFEMSGLEQDVDMNQEPKTPSNAGNTSTTGSSSGSGIVRTNSVKARANMFQQMQENKANNGGLNREERTSPKRVPRRLSPSPAPLNTTLGGDEPRTPNNPAANTDEEIEPSSLPVSERLRFFSSLTESNNRNSGSFTRSPPMSGIERSSSLSSYANYFSANTPRSSTNQSSASVTPTPMECGQQWPSVLNDSPTILKQDQIINHLKVITNGASESFSKKNSSISDFTDSREVIKADIVKTSPFLQASGQPVSATPAHLSNADTTPTSTLTPTMRRIKLKIIGKLMLPTTFLNNDRNNNQTSGQTKENTTPTASLTFSEQISVESNDSMSSQQPPKKIGKIKSPFIENCNQMQQNKMQLNVKSMKFDYRQNSHPPQQASTALASLENSAEHHASHNGLSKYFNNSAPNLSNGHGHVLLHSSHHTEDSNTDSGKENIDTSSSAGTMDSSTTMASTKTTPVVEIKRKLTRKNTPNAQSLHSGGIVSRTQVTPRSASFNGSSKSSTPQVDSKYAKYFGLKTPTNTSSHSNGLANGFKTPQIPPPLPKQPPPQLPKSSETLNISQSMSPSAEAINQHVQLWVSNGASRGVKRMACSSPQEMITKFEDIVVADDELRQADEEFDRLFGELDVQPATMVEFEKIYRELCDDVGK